MKWQQDFNYRRAGLFLRKDLLENWRGIGVVKLIIVSYMLLTSHIGAFFFEKNTWDYQSGLSFIAWPLLLIATSLAFAELGDKARNEDFLLLPVAPAEKFAARLLMVGIILPLGFWIFYTAATFLVGVSLWLLHGLPLGGSFAELSPHGHLRAIGEFWGALLPIQSVVFLGAIWFKKWHLLRTALAVLLIGIGMSVLLSIAASLFFSDISWHGNWHDLWFLDLIGSEYLGWGVRVFLSLTCLWLAWMRFREVQSSDGI
ncbi:MAG: hypothetical protein AAF975_07710 [Spirochaetota bacterium]